MLPHQTDAWAALQQLALKPQPRILDLFAEEPARLRALSLDVAGLQIDLSKLPMSVVHVQALSALAAEADLPGWRSKLVAGEIVNPSEGRAATHMQLREKARRSDHRPVLDIAHESARARLAPFRHLIHIGIGGSALGPHLLVDALGTKGDGPEVHVAANIDGAALARAFAAAIRPKRC
jgi:glucose-6-phosphate isomerase